MYKTLLKNGTIRNYLLAGGISRLGDTLSGMAFLFIAYDLTQSKALTTWMAMAETLPYLIFGLAGGVIVDWFPKKKLLIWLDLARVPLVLSVVLLYSTEDLTYPLLLIISFLIQSIGCFFNPALRTVLPLLVKEEELTSVNGLYDTVTRGVTVLSPLLAVGLLQTFGAIHFFTVDSLTYAVSALCLSTLTLHEHIQPQEKSLRHLFRSIIDFFRWAIQHSTISKLFTWTILTVFLNTWVWQVGILLALTELTSQSEEWYSLIQGVYGILVIAASLLYPYLFKKYSLLHYGLGVSVWGIGILYYSFFFSLPHFFIGAAIVGIGLPLAGMTRVFLLQTLVPTEKRGRAFSSNAVALYCSNTVSLLIYGVLLSYFSIQPLMIMSGLGVLLSGLIGLTLISSAKLGRGLMINPFK